MPHQWGGKGCKLRLAAAVAPQGGDKWPVEGGQGGGARGEDMIRQTEGEEKIHFSVVKKKKQREQRSGDILMTKKRVRNTTWICLKTQILPMQTKQRQHFHNPNNRRKWGRRTFRYITVCVSCQSSTFYRVLQSEREARNFGLVPHLADSAHISTVWLQIGHVWNINWHYWRFHVLPEYLPTPLTPDPPPTIHNNVSLCRNVFTALFSGFLLQRLSFYQMWKFVA